MTHSVYVYHPQHPARVVTSDEAPTYYEDGWYDTPAKFPKVQAHGLAAEVTPEIKKKGRPPKAKLDESGIEPDDAA